MDSVPTLSSPELPRFEARDASAALAVEATSMLLADDRSYEDGAGSGRNEVRGFQRTSAEQGADCAAVFSSPTLLLASSTSQNPATVRLALQSPQHAALLL